MDVARADTQATAQWRVSKQALETAKDDETKLVDAEAGGKNDKEGRESGPGKPL